MPPYLLTVSFGLIDIEVKHGPIEIAVGTHRMPREVAAQSVEAGNGEIDAVLLEVGDVLIRHPWALHRGTPNLTDTPRALATIRYARRWYVDDSRDVNAIPKSIWPLTEEQKAVLRFPLDL